MRLVQIVNGVTLQHKNATRALTWVQASRFVLERVLRERLLATYGNVQLRCGAWVSGVEHGDGDARGSVTGAHGSLARLQASPYHVATECLL